MVSSQLQAIKSQFHGGIGDQLPTKRPFTRPSILFDPKEAADIDLRTILPIAISGTFYTLSIFNPTHMPFEFSKYMNVIIFFTF